MRLWMVRLTGLLALVGVTALCMLTNAPRIEAELAKRAAGSAASLGAAWAAVEADGRDIIVRGVAPDADAKAQVGKAIAAIPGVRTVRFIADTTVSKPNTSAKPDPVFIASRDTPESPIVLSGVVPALVEGDALMALLPSPPVRIDADQLETAEVHLKGAPEILAATIAATSLLDKGQVEVRPGHIAVTGASLDSNTAAAIRDKFSPFLGLGYVLEVAEAGSTGPDSAASASGASVGINTLEHCQQRINSVLAKYGIRFKNGSAALQRGSTKPLKQLAAMLNACPGSVVTITGHTDSRGDAATNQRLSKARARVVGDFLMAQGVARSSIRTKGAGEAAPIADNKTAAGRARNRRIEITLEEMER